MPLPKISEARELSDEKLSEEILAVKKQLFQLRLQKATRQLDKPHQFRHAKHRLAQLLTVEGERKRAENQPPQAEK
ncbi:50S ribosomal protein L29 [Nostoc linckia z18]|jgi:large subunit ribosomal protein L29|uniref:Large ribosomal subunit protein uL29 n=2 Tax=Nostoc linckia TaxID=92942 RepID=A0A9Q5ZE27_NOSLI|nr:50S ribosomal protein L29 [Nostoc linckia]MDZ8013395.1 50S ribosomal protein L29 [Nostoc sp. ZfuVER08]PHK38946.1 50S ribosomal protein L29 [Nostoc linckia z15]PHK47803.1 50S ribosomal protein L29 [Nostoc linckia z16]PHJ66021.1 50S ribosomal protein L29 [Nostoc linckia z1]PHJ68927.1 50S ribosomal protein L29 [Nostoc linckia z3]